MCSLFLGHSHILFLSGSLLLCLFLFRHNGTSAMWNWCEALDGVIFISYYYSFFDMCHGKMHRIIYLIPGLFLCTLRTAMRWCSVADCRRGHAFTHKYIYIYDRCSVSQTYARCIHMCVQHVFTQCICSEDSRFLHWAAPVRKMNCLLRFSQSAYVPDTNRKLSNKERKNRMIIIKNPWATKRYLHSILGK